MSTSAPAPVITATPSNPASRPELGPIYPTESSPPIVLSPPSSNSTPLMSFVPFPPALLIGSSSLSLPQWRMRRPPYPVLIVPPFPNCVRGSVRPSKHTLRESARPRTGSGPHAEGHPTQPPISSPAPPILSPLDLWDRPCLVAEHLPNLSLPLNLPPLPRPPHRPQG